MSARVYQLDLPPAFAEDCVECGAFDEGWGVLFAAYHVTVAKGRRVYRLRLDAAGVENLADRARHYTEPGRFVGVPGYQGLAASARATIKALIKARSDGQLEGVPRMLGVDYK